MSRNLSPTVSSTNSWAIRMVDSVLPGYSQVHWRWHYEHGLFVKALLDVGSATCDLRYEKFVRDWVDHFVTPSGHIHTYRLTEFSLD